MISFRNICALSLIILLGTWAGARTFESSTSENTSQEEHILSVVPQSIFSVDPRLKKNVDFWIKIYTEYDSKQGVMHDAKYIDHIYENLTFETTSQPSSQRYMKKLKNRWKDILMAVHRKQRTPEKMTDEEKRVFEMFADVKETDKFLKAAHHKRLRFQLGQKDRFREGLYYSGYYIPIMEEIFKREGLPLELTRLPFVESSFNIKARSKVGASGIWQFM
ncbi:MAG: transglycosylase SLT domain-containing protein, partial [Bdellovibrionota bacterium]